MNINTIAGNGELKLKSTKCRLMFAVVSRVSDGRDTGGTVGMMGAMIQFIE